jgi:hypothetical protein
MSLSTENRLISLLNIYQSMFIHYLTNLYLKLHVNKDNSLLSFFKGNKDSHTIQYQFKDFILSNLDIKHVIFRANKIPPGSYSKLAYNNDAKNSILPNFNDLRPLLILYEFEGDNVLGLKFKFQFFDNKDITDQLDEIVIQFIACYVSEEDRKVIHLPPFIKNYINDFGSLHEFFGFLSEKYNKNNEKYLIFQSKVEDKQNFEFLIDTKKLTNKVKKEKYVISYD